MNKYKNIRRECNKKVNYQKKKNDLKLKKRKEFNLKLKKESNPKNLNEQRKSQCKLNLKKIYIEKY